jgi:hypothetical protein
MGAGWSIPNAHVSTYPPIPDHAMTSWSFAWNGALRMWPRRSKNGIQRVNGSVCGIPLRGQIGVPQSQQQDGTMKDSDGPGRRWFYIVQSMYVLPIARGIYLLIALVSLLAMIGGSVFAVYLQTSIASRPETIPVPPSYSGAAVTVDASARTVDLARVGARLGPPTNIRFVATTGIITEALGQSPVLGHFAADTPNQLAPYPDGVSILGGRDAELFERVLDKDRQMIGLAPREALAQEITEGLRDIKAPKSRTFEIRVIARDRYGITSTPTDLSFTIQFGPKLGAGAQPQPAVQPEAQRAPTELQKVAREIAQILEPTVNPAYFSAFEAAAKAPSRCGASDSDQTFIANYRRALNEVRSQLTASNVEAFYLGLCDAWKDALQREAAARDRAEQERQAERRRADEARERAQAHNNELLQRHADKVHQAQALTLQAVSVVGGALAIFLSISLVLAFLAIEGHSRAVRTAIESLARMSEERRISDTQENESAVL